MSITDTDTHGPGRRRLPWVIPAVVAAGVAVGAVVLNSSSAGASPSLPARSAQQLIADVASSSTRALSGTVTETANLGLPSLPGTAGSASLSWQQLLTGTNTAQVWIDGPDRQRIAVVAQLSEADVVHNGSDVWTYTSATNEVSHQVLPSHEAPAAVPMGAALTPTAVAQQALAALDPTTAVSVSDTQTVAGRPAYTLLLQPRDNASTVREVAIAVDSATGVPLRVDVFGAASKPAFEVGFTEVDFSTPPAATFAFTPPAGATVTTNPFGSDGSDHRGTAPAPAAATVEPTVLGTGWTSVLEFPSASAVLSSSSGLLDQTAGEAALPTTTLPDGSKLLHTALVNALLLPDGRAFVGAVSQQQLQQTAANTPR